MSCLSIFKHINFPLYKNSIRYTAKKNLNKTVISKMYFKHTPSVITITLYVFAKNNNLDNIKMSIYNIFNLLVYNNTNISNFLSKYIYINKKVKFKIKINITLN